MKVTVLIENSPGPRADLVAEFGLSLYIETGTLRILMDTGTSGRFAENAERLGVDLGGVTHAVLSHGHYDHGGGLEAFFTRNTHAKLFARRGADQAFFGSKWPTLPGFLQKTGVFTR